MQKQTKRNIQFVAIAFLLSTVGFFGYQQLTMDRTPHVQISQQELTKRVYFASKLLARNTQAISLAKAAASSNNVAFAAVGTNWLGTLTAKNEELTTWITEQHQLGQSGNQAVTEFGIPSQRVRSAISSKSDVRISEAMLAIIANDRVITNFDVSGDAKLSAIASEILSLDRETEATLRSVRNG